MKRIVRVFMSYGMHGRTEEEQNEIRIKLAHRAYKHDFGEPVWVKVIDNHNAKTNGGRMSFLGMAIKKMDSCDAVVFDDDWKDFKGCVIEHHVAELYGLEIIS